MSYSQLQTPQRPLPGAFFNTPAGPRFQAPPPWQSIFDPPGEPARRRPSTTSNQTSNPPPDPDPNQAPAPPPQNPPPPTLQPIQRAAGTINTVLSKEGRFPELDSYVRQGHSSDYDLPNATSQAAWAPFQRTKLYDFPSQILEQYNEANIATMMGLFADLNHAWVTIDSALYLWDYTNPVPEIIGFEEQSNTITAVKLVVPRPGVFVDTVTHLLVVATTAEIILLGLAAQTTASGVKTVSIYQTRMALSIRGINVQVIEGSAATGRIFFAGSGDNEVYELTYQQEEKWFASRCGKVNHTSPGYTSLVPSLWGGRAVEHVVSIVVDDTRRLLYTLSSESSIRTFYMDSSSTLQQVIEKKKQECLRDISHMISSSPLLTTGLQIISISPISAKEGTKLHLLATTSLGCRLYLSATRGYGYGSSQGAPQSMQVQHIKFPPSLAARPAQGAQPADTTPEISSLALSTTRSAIRFPPGIFFDFVSRPESANQDALFVAAPDTGRIAAQARDSVAQPIKFFEQGCWLALNSRAEDVGLITPSFAAAQTPEGFGNELAVQYDNAPCEVAILTNSGIHIIRRRRLVDIFAAAIRNGGNEEGLEVEVKKFIRNYGRAETTATALAVACGQGNDVPPGADTRTTRVNDPQTLEFARKAFVEFGGRPSLNENNVSEVPSQAVDNVRPSSRHEGLALYMARLIRSLWKASVITQFTGPTGPVSIRNTVPVAKLVSVQEDLTKLQSFLEANKTFIEGLSGPESLQRVASQQEEIALRGEHQALHSLQRLNSSIIEGISFVRMLFEERIDEIWTSLDDGVRQRFRDLTYEILFATDSGKDLAKILVKAIVNRNIANGSNVDTVAEALRRRCGSFCSADDVIIFKAQEQLKKASEVGANSDMGRNLLNESLRLFQEVAGALSFENLGAAADQFTALKFYAGAISLGLLVARESDRGNRALSWAKDGKPTGDPRQTFYNFRKRCYDLIHLILQAVDDATAGEPEMIDGRPTLSATKRNEAYTVVNDSDDELFQNDLYEWYLSQGLVERLLKVNSPFVIQFLSRSAAESVERADLFCQFYVHRENFYEAAVVQLDLAKSKFPISLASRIQYLSQAKTNAQAQSPGIGRQARQVLLYEITELLDVANIQDELLHRLRGDDRLADRLDEINASLDGEVQNLTTLFNSYADQAGYFDICLRVFEAADHRNEADINATWQQLLERTHNKAETDNNALPYEAIITIVHDMHNRLGDSESTFNPQMIIPLVERYALERQRNVGSENWVPDLFLSVNFVYEKIVAVLQQLWFGNVTPFVGSGKRIVAAHLVYIINAWYEDCVRSNQRIFGSDANAQEIGELLTMISDGGLEPQHRDMVEDLRRRIVRTFR